MAALTSGYQDEAIAPWASSLRSSRLSSLGAKSRRRPARSAGRHPASRRPAGGHGADHDGRTVGRPDGVTIHRPHTMLRPCCEHAANHIAFAVVDGLETRSFIGTL